MVKNAIVCWQLYATNGSCCFTHMYFSVVSMTKFYKSLVSLLLDLTSSANVNSRIFVNVFVYSSAKLQLQVR